MADNPTPPVPAVPGDQPGKYRKKPVVIEARQWDGTAEAATPIIDWICGSGHTARYSEADLTFEPKVPPLLKIDTLEGVMAVSPGDYVIRGMRGEFYPCKPDIFAATYDEESSGNPTNGHHAEAFRQGHEPQVRWGWHCLTCDAEEYVFSMTAAEAGAAAHMSPAPSGLDREAAQARCDAAKNGAWLNLSSDLDAALAALSVLEAENERLRREIEGVASDMVAALDGHKRQALATLATKYEAMAEGECHDDLSPLF